MNWYCKIFKKSNQKKIIALQRLSEVETKKKQKQVIFEWNNNESLKGRTCFGQPVSVITYIRFFSFLTETGGSMCHIICNVCVQVI
jgi:hypothetical protein